MHRSAGVVVEQALVEARPQLGPRELAITAPAEAIAVEVDVAHLVHALVNVLVDAARVTPCSDAIAVSWGREFGHAFVKITDGGGPAHLDKAFDLFVPSDRGGGLNLGLALAKQLVDLHRGTLVATTAPTGTLFEVRLPATEFPLDAARNKLVQRTMIRPRSLRVLVVAADDELGEVTTTLLIGRGHQVSRALEARTALALIAETRPDVVLIDLTRPPLDGCELVRLARALEPPLPTRFVAITDGTSAGLTARKRAVCPHARPPAELVRGRRRDRSRLSVAVARVYARTRASCERATAARHISAIRRRESCE